MMTFPNTVRELYHCLVLSYFSILNIMTIFPLKIKTNRQYYLITYFFKLNCEHYKYIMMVI